MLPMQLEDTAIRYRNKEASADLVLPVELVGTTTLEEAQENLRNNLSHPMWLNESPAHDGIAVLCGNGPSLADTLEEIRDLDATVFACNDAANLLIDNGIGVDYQVILEAQPRIVEELAPADKHLLASMCNPEVFKRCANAILWHPYSKWVWDEIPKEHPPFVYVGGSSTVSMFALSICYTMGFRKIHAFGLDSSHKDGRKHATPEFDAPGCLVSCNVEALGKSYPTTYDMKEQVRVFLVMRAQLKTLGCAIEVHGSGLLPDVARAA